MTRPVLEYRPSQPREPWWRRGWIVATSVGALAGALLNASVGSFVCAGPMLGLFVGSTTAVLVASRKWTYVLVAGATAVAALVALAFVRVTWSGGSLSLDNFPVDLLVLSAIVMVPALLGALLVSSVDAATRPGPRD